MSRLNNKAADHLAHEIYRDSRSGAVSVRGYHFQDAIGAWFAARLMTGESAGVYRVIPEDWEDLTLEGRLWVHIQVKSRQQHLGFFKTSTVASALSDMWAKHLDRVSAGISSDKLLLVLERGICNRSPNNQEILVEDLLQWNRILSLIVKKQRFTDELVQCLASITYVHIIDAPTAHGESVALIEESSGTYHAAATVITQQIRSRIVECTDRNATRDLSQGRVGLRRNDVSQILDDTLSLVDTESLEEALSRGECEALDFSCEEPLAGFYHGISAQPGHIAANLVAARPDLTTRAIDSLKAGKSVIFEGPSGVGKSSVMWHTAYLSPEILWYRIRPSAHRNSVQRILKLVNALSPSSERKVGLVMDGVGQQESNLWDGLAREAESIPGLVLLGSVRTEDLHLVETRVACSRIPVALDDTTAAQIHNKLLQDQATDIAHWREAFDASNGLTMEFTHLLTRGKRIEEVVQDQVSRRVREERDTELEILALVATADKWGAELELDAILESAHFDSAEIRNSLARLSNEHLVRHDQTIVKGIHPLRSKFLSAAVHHYPPPSIKTTVRRLFSLSTPSNLARIIFGCYSEGILNRKELLNELTNHLTHVDHSSRIEYLDHIMQAVRDLDFHNQIHKIDKVLTSCEVPVPLRTTALQFAMTTTPPDLLNLQVGSALPGLRAILENPLELGNGLFTQLPKGFVFDLWRSCTSTPEVLSVLGALVDIELPVELSDSSLLVDSGLGAVVDNASLEELGSILLASKAIDPALTRILAECAGGNSGILKRLQAEVPWVTSGEMVNQYDEDIPTIRAVYFSEALQGDPENFNLELAKTVARLFPLVSHVDVRSQYPGEIDIFVGRLELGKSKLRLENMHSSISTMWRRRMLSILTVEYSLRSQTDRVSLAAELLDDTDRYLQLLGRSFLFRESKVDAQRKAMAKQMDLKLEKLTPFVASLTDDSEHAAFRNDSLHSLVDGILNNAAVRIDNPETNFTTLSLFFGTYLRRYLHESVSNEAWALVDFRPDDICQSIDSQLLALSRLTAEIGLYGAFKKSTAKAANSITKRKSLLKAASVSQNLQEERREEFWRTKIERAEKDGIDVVSYFSEPESRDFTVDSADEVLFAIHISSVQEWSPSLNSFVQVLEYEQIPNDLAAKMLIVPAIAGKIIKELCVYVGPTVLPAPSELESWAGEITSHEELPLYSFVTEALMLLDELSGLAYLDFLRDIESLQPYAEQLVSRYDKCIEQLESMYQADSRIGVFYEEIQVRAQRVQAELEMNINSNVEESFLAVEAAKIATQTNENEDEEHTRIALKLLSIQYDVDPLNSDLVDFLSAI